MNLQWCNILDFGELSRAAADDDGLINILVLVVLLVIGLIGHLIKKAQEKRQVEEADRKVEQAKRRHAAKALSEHAQTKPFAPAAGAKQQVPVIHAAADLGQGVSQEVLQVRKQLAAKEMRQRQRLAPMKPLQPTIGGKEMRTKHAPKDGPEIHINLTSPKAARTAIICAEILGLPKALRTDPEPWDM